MPDSRKYINGSLLITPELCEEHKGCGQGLAYMRRFYPNGFTVDDVYTKKARHIPMHFICWGYHFLPFTDEDKRKFFEHAKITNCSAFMVSHHIDNCHKITDSSYCSNSDTIFSSRNIHDSQVIGYSNDVQHSSYVNAGTEIYDSTHIMKSERIVSSHYVLKSKDVNNSYGIVNCQNVENSLYMVDTHDISNCIMSFGNDGMSNRIFCSEKCDANYNYAIFDKSVSEQKFAQIFEAVSEVLKEEPVLEDVNDFSRLKPVIIYWNRAFNKFYDELAEILYPLSKEDQEFLYQHTLCQKILERF